METKKKIKKRYVVLSAILILLIGIAIAVFHPRGDVNTSLAYRAFYSMFEVINALPRQSGGAEPVADPSNKLRKNFDVSQETVGDLVYYTVEPKEGAGEKTLLYLHGGAYVHEISSFQWNLIGKLVEQTNCKAIVPIYPLAGVQTYDKTFPMLHELYRALLPQFDLDNLVLMGDSAGGGMSLSFAESLKQEGLPQPHDIVLLSPWLDASMTNPEIAAYEDKDPVLSVSGLLQAAELYAGDAGLMEPLVSPIYGDFTDLGKLTVFAGTYELFLPDARKFVTMAEEQGIEITYHEYPEMIHAWVIFPMREADQAIRQIVDEVF